jgi:hypothetical protein
MCGPGRGDGRDGERIAAVALGYFARLDLGAPHVAAGAERLMSARHAVVVEQTREPGWSSTN